MGKSGMSIHSDASFNESESIRILSSILESKHSIKTFFSSNDRTPNHDGFFELVSNDQAPKKQFIVQIKKAENLTPNVSGTNKAKYSYPLNTNFLYYVKEKVTESPAIYFVVDIITKRIFWLYLSDSVLMKLDFEGKETVSFPFGEENVLDSVDAFVNELNLIVLERNKLFLRKTQDEIAEIQEAADYINGLLENDFFIIKKSVFPNLWRFGIKQSTVSNISMNINGETSNIPDSSFIALYPQIKGIPDTGIHEYSFEKSNLLDQITIAREEKPMEYSRNSLHKIIKIFFENYIPFNCYPATLLEEQVGSFINESNHLFACSQKRTVRLIDAELRFCYLANYIGWILSEDVSTVGERQIKESLLRRLMVGEKNFCRMVSTIALNGGSDSFKQFCQNHPNLPNVFYPELFELLDFKYIQLYCCIHELKDREILEFPLIWTYSFLDMQKLPEDDFDDEVNKIIAHWFDALPQLYKETYQNLFDKDIYRFKGKYVYKSTGRKLDNDKLTLVNTVVHYYPDEKFSITNDNNIDEHFTDEYRKQGVEWISCGFQLNDFLREKTLFSDSVKCLLYEGICNELGFKAERLNVHKSSISNGLLLFD